MPQISTIMLNLDPFNARQIEEIVPQTQRPLDDMPLVSSLMDAVELLRRAARGSAFCFRIEDNPNVIVVWHSFGSAAIVHTLQKRRLVQIDIILLGRAEDDAEIIERARSTLLLTDTEIEQVSQVARPAVVRIGIHNDESIVGLLALVLFIPMLCERYGVE